MVFFVTIGLIAIAVCMPLVAMYAAGEFVGQRRPPAWLQMVMVGVIGIGLLVAVMSTGFAMKADADGMTAKEWVILAWVAGSALTGQIGLLNWIHAKTREDRAREL